MGELALLVLLCALGAAFPQAESGDSPDPAWVSQGGPIVTKLVHYLALDHVFSSPLFLLVAILTTVSLLIVIAGQLRRARLQWTQSLTEAHFRSAPFRTEFDLPHLPNSVQEPVSKLWTERRVALLGSPLFHIGLLAIIAAGALRALFGSAAAVDLIEGETLHPTASAWGGQFPGILGKSFRLGTPVTLDAVRVVNYNTGTLRDLQIRVSLPTDAGTTTAELAVNHDLKAQGGRLFLGSAFGPAALLEWQQPGGVSERKAVLLKQVRNGTFEGALNGADGRKLYLRAQLDANRDHPPAVELRIMKESALLYTGELRQGETIGSPDGSGLTLHSTPLWVRLQGSRDPSLWLAYVGFTFVILGSVLMFAVVKTDFCLVVTPGSSGAHVFFAMRPHRFAPLFQERFEKLVLQYRRDLASSKPLEKENAQGHLQALPHAVSFFLLSAFAAALAGCGPSVEKQARTLVEHYNQVVSEAYRRGDIRLVDSVVGPNEGKKLTGLIGVRLDAGITLDSQLLSLEITGVEKAGDEMRVQTKEKWSYRDRKIGTGEQVAEASEDSYEMLYVFKKIEKAWLVDEIRFTSPPQIGRKQLPFPNGRAPVSHGMASEAPTQEVNK